MNIFHLPPDLTAHEEYFEPFAKGNDVLIERIISTGQRTPEGTWLEQNHDEWVVLLQGEARLEFEDGTTADLARGDHLFIPARKKHRVAETRVEPPCIWLAVHATMSPMLDSSSPLRIFNP